MFRACEGETLAKLSPSVKKSNLATCINSRNDTLLFAISCPRLEIIVIMVSTMKNWFTEHPKSVNETYYQHLWFSLTSAIRLIFAGIAAIVHAFFPFLFISTASKIVAKIVAAYCKNDRRDAFLNKINNTLPNPLEPPKS